MSKRLGIGFIGSGFITRFHIQSFVGVRNADILGVWSPNRTNAQSTAGLASRPGIELEMNISADTAGRFFISLKRTSCGIPPERGGLFFPGHINWGEFLLEPSRAFR